MASITVTPALPPRSIAATIKAIGDIFLAGIPAWRKYSGGDWYYVRTLMHPQTESWRKDPAEDIYEKPIASESYSTQGV